MKAWTIPIPMMLAVLLSVQITAQELRLAIERLADQTFRLSVLAPAAPRQHMFVEFSTNGVWYPAYFTSSNSNNALLYTATNAGPFRLFRAAQALTIANEVKASWDRLGVTNYVFNYSASCFCRQISGTVTVRSNKVVKVENAIDRQGQPVPDSQAYGFVISDVFNEWVRAEPSGGVAQELQFDFNGFPTFISIDPNPRTADEELIYAINSFTLLQ